VTILTDRSLIQAVAHRAIRVSSLTGGESPGGLVQPASIELHLGEHLLGFPMKGAPLGVCDPENPPEMEPRGWAHSDFWGDHYLLQYGEMVLGATYERVAISRGYVGQLEGKSTLGRLGLFVHITAGYIDPGWGSEDNREFGGTGRALLGGAPITLELLNMGPHQLLLRPGMPIAQLIIHSAIAPAVFGYGHPRNNSHYADSGSWDGPVGARPIGYRSLVGNRE
jgi:dCTP deaminase